MNWFWIKHKPFKVVAKMTVDSPFAVGALTLKD